MPKMTDGEATRLVVHRRRVRAQLLLGPVTQRAFDREPAIDGGDRVGRVAARVHELRKLDWIIETSRGPGGYAIYTLLSEPLDADKVIDTPVSKVQKIKGKRPSKPRRKKTEIYPNTPDALAMFEEAA